MIAMQIGPRGTHVLYFEGGSGSGWTSHRVNYLSGVKRGEVNTATITINVGLRPQELAAKPADFAPDIPSR
jgi:hypothetical protein